MQTFWQDVRYGLRMLGKNPAFSAVAVLTLALGITANGTIFSWINSTLLNPIPGIRDTSNMLTIMRGERSEHPTPPFSYLDYVDLRDNSKTFAGLLGYHDDYVAITGSGRPERFYAALTSANYFDVLGVRPLLGRTFLFAEENRADATVVVIGYDVWKNRFGGDKNIVGKTVQINLHPYTVIGVTPRGFQGCKTGLRTEMWFPLGMDSLVWGSNNRIERRGTFWLNVLGKLRPGVDRRQAESELNSLMQGIVVQYPNLHQGPNQISTDPLWRSPFGANVYMAGTLPILLGLASVLLLLACANVANLMLVRSVARRREIALRLSMGASRWRIFRQLLVESLMMALTAGGVAMVLTGWTAGSFAAFFPPNDLPLTLNGQADRTVLLVTALISVITAVIAGVLPALRTSSLSPVTVLKEEAISTSGGLHKSRLSSGLVIAQISLSFLLLISAGLLVRSLQKARNFDAGFDPNHVFVATYDLSPAGYSRAKGIEFHQQVLAQLRAIPGIESATIADFSPLSFTLHTEYVQAEGYAPQPRESMEIDRGVVGSGYLETLRTPLLAGRDFTDHDHDGAQPVAIVNQAFVDRYWPGQNAIGKRVQAGRWFTVVGVAGNAKYRRLIYDPAPMVYFPLSQWYEEYVIIQVRAAGDPRALRAAVEKKVHTLNPDLPLFNETTMLVSMQMGSIFERIAVAFAGSFGVLSLVLAAVGIYGVVAYTTKQRTREIGIRIALGAQRGDILRQVLGQGFTLMIIGLAIGLGVSYALTRFLQGMLFGVGATDSVTFLAVGFLLCLVTLAACYIPARRATKTEPMVALRYE